ncbi:MAG: hypothetical protein AAGK97_12695 [Bacteroidota bacterium]
MSTFFKVVGPNEFINWIYKDPESGQYFQCEFASSSGLSKLVSPVSRTLAINGHVS